MLVLPWDNNFENFAASPLIHGTISILIILGGLGFIVLRELREVFLKKKFFCASYIAF